MFLKDSAFIHQVFIECLLCARHCARWYENVLGTFSFLGPLHSAWFVLVKRQLRFENDETKTVTVNDGQHY